MTEQNKPKILAIVGPTASGKSALALALAKRLGGEVVSCDSMQVYRRMDIGTAKPTAAEMDGIAHHLIDIAQPHEAFSCADYVLRAKECIKELGLRGVLPIICGGTGLYLDALLRGGFDEESAGDPARREALLAYAAQNGNHALHQRLAEIDPESAAAIHENNVKRVARAIEIFERTGKTKTQLDRVSREWESPYSATVIGLRYPEREILYQRIEERVDKMLRAGLLEETRALVREGVFSRNATAAQAIGYKELLAHLSGEESLETATEALKTATRRYAKRQMTWFGAKDYVKWIDMTQNGTPRALSDVIEEAVMIWEKDGNVK